MKIKGIYLLYRSLQAFGWPIVIVYLLVRGLRRRAYFASLDQRLGFLPGSFRQTVPGAIWLHAVSVGETVAATELIGQLRSELPRSPIFVSVSTLAGYDVARSKLRGLAEVFYAPVDYVSAVRRVLRTLRPALVIVMETEIWPNLFRETKRTGAGLLVVNGRISDRAAVRYEALAWFFGSVLGHADLILAQNEAMRERFLRTGAPAGKTRAGGNLKYDLTARAAAADSPVRQFIGRVQPSAVWIAASTMPPAVAGDPDEDATVIAAFQQVAAREPGLLLMLAPRKPEHFDAAARALQNAEVAFVRRSTLHAGDSLSLPGALLLDSIGELASLFPLADVVFMGGTLASRGGHNILEPALAARPVIVGPHLENFAEMAADFRAAGALVEVRDTASLAAAVAEMLANRERAAALGAQALACAEARQGATGAAVQAAREVFGGGVPAYRPPQPAFAFLWLCSQLWTAGAAFDRRRQRSRTWRLEAPVISIGNITAGGTGKTPVVVYLAQKLRSAGWTPGILTRGYGRRSPNKYVALAANSRVPVDESGDEPQMFLRAGVAHVGIGPDRWRAGRLVAQKFGSDILLLDDGFQHVRLERRVDIVLVDALEPFGRGFVLPLGRLREPLEGLARADLFVITRSDFGRVAEGTERCLRRYNPRAPIFHTRVRAEAWMAYGGGEEVAAQALPQRRVAAFCGLGNPESFWSSLEALGLEVVDRLQFDDHHAYRPAELRRMARHFREAGAQAVVTTEKDLYNLSEGADGLMAPLPLYWLRIGVEIDREAEFLKAVTEGGRT